MPSMTRKAFLRTLIGASTASGLGACRPAAPTSGTPAAGGAPAVPAGGSRAPSRTERLAARVFDQTASAYAIGAVYIGDRLGLFKAMAGAGPMTVEQLSRKTGFDGKYVGEWLRTMATSGYVDYRAGGTFELPPEHLPVLVDEDSPAFAVGFSEGAIPDIHMIPSVMDGFRTGKGVPYESYPPETFDSIERGSRPDYLHLLVQQWVPAIPGAADTLRAGGTTADLGSGAGIASIVLAKAFPRARAFGFEPYAPSVARARDNAQRAGVSDRVKFQTFDGVNVPGGPYDLITINYSLHHAGKPVELMRSARSRLAPGGAFVIAEYRKSARLEEDIDTERRIMYGIGLLECMPTAVAEGGPGYGTGIPEPEIRRLAEAAGYRECLRIVPEDPIRALFVLRG